MLLVATRLGSAKARVALTFILFLVIWLLLSIPDAFAASTITRKSSFTYDAATGLLLSETVEPDKPQLGVVTTYAYDPYGNKTSATTANLPGAAGDAVFASRTTTLTYETNGRFVTGVEGPHAGLPGTAADWTEDFLHDPEFGGVTSRTNVNNRTATVQYDSFGRATLEIGVDGNRIAYTYAYCTTIGGGTLSCPSTTIVYAITVQPQNASGVGNGPWVRTYFDKHGRPRVVDTIGFAGQTIRKWTNYDAFGRTASETRPYNLSGGTALYINYAYDALGRTTTITLPDSSQTTYGYNGLTTTVTNDLGQTETTLKNARGEIVWVQDANIKKTFLTYDAFGNRTSIKDSLNNVQTMTYDDAGRKIWGVDPDLGYWQYSYNVLGELKSQTDAKGQTTTMAYDILGRPTSRIEPGLTSTWTYDLYSGTDRGRGKLRTASTSDGYLLTQYYDSFERPASTATRSETGASTYTSTTTYDANGRIDTVAYPSGFAIKNYYSSLGYHYLVRKNGTTENIWQANAFDAELRVTQETAGNGIVTTRTFDANRGFITAIAAGTANAVADFTFAFDTIGNLEQRQDMNIGALGATETFTYDDLNRLTSYTTPQGTKTVTYNDLGNIMSKSDVGTYTYPAAATPRPHAVTATSGGTLRPAATTYSYDLNGAMTAGNGATITWTAFNKIQSMTKGTTAVSFVYGPDHQRVKQVSSAGTTYYFADAASGVMFERVVGASVTTWHDYLFAGGEMVAFQRDEEGTANPVLTRYFVKDHLGSVAVLTDETGAVAERLSYDAWGKRRYENWADDPSNVLTAQTTRGFTGHEMIDDLDLVNMNGRVYDPTLGRFLSADPFIHDVTNSQDLNRYSYVHNNPLSYTDMNGYGFFKSIGKFFKKILKPLIAIVAAFVLQIWVAPALFGYGGGPISAAIFAAEQPFAAGIAAGVSAGVSNVIMTGRPKAFLSGFGQGIATFGIGSAIGNATGIAGAAKRFVAHGAVGCAFAEAGGSSCSSGFLAAGFSSAAGAFDLGSTWGNLARSVIAGGIGSELGGGKFANGAVTASFVYLLNEASHSLALKQLKRFTDKIHNALEGVNLMDLDSVKAALRQVDLPNWKWLRTVLVTANGTIAMAWQGVSGSVTLAYDRLAKDFRLFAGGGPAFGADVSVGLNGGFFTGGLDDYEGWAENWEADFPGWSVTVFRGVSSFRDGKIGPYTGYWGVTVGVGVGLGGAGSYTCAVPLRAGRPNPC